jgi:hypothetical protein
MNGNTQTLENTMTKQERNTRFGRTRNARMNRVAMMSRTQLVDEAKELGIIDAAATLGELTESAGSWTGFLVSHLGVVVD